MPSSLGAQLAQILPLLVLVVAMLLITWLPQRKRNKQVKEMLEQMKKGDWVRTIGGISGRIYHVKGDIVTIETGPDKVKINLTRGAIATVGEAAVEADGISEVETRVAVESKDAKKKK